jgi:hypothetical protein
MYQLLGPLYLDAFRTQKHRLQQQLYPPLLQQRHYLCGGQELRHMYVTFQCFQQRTKLRAVVPLSLHHRKAHVRHRRCSLVLKENEVSVVL